VTASHAAADLSDGVRIVKHGAGAHGRHGRGAARRRRGRSLMAGVVLGRLALMLIEIILVAAPRGRLVRGLGGALGSLAELHGEMVR
jgi:hypothetical protein